MSVNTYMNITPMIDTAYATLDNYAVICQVQDIVHHNALLQTNIN